MSKKYFFPPESGDDNLAFTKFSPTFVGLACTYHNIFSEVFAPATKPDYKETFRLYPAMAIFRHAIELLLKAIIKDVCAETPPLEHHLVTLFEMARANRQVSDLLGTEDQFVTEALSEFQDCDKKSDAFRYAFGTQGEFHFHGLPRSVNGGRLFGACEKLWGALLRAHGAGVAQIARPDAL